jgi:tRNA (guanine26-N2/guanine27-N2)-dimethyltransferase
MTLNRDISVLIVKILKPKTALDLLSATGVRALRLKKEANVKEVWANDAKKTAFALIKENVRLNKLNIKVRNDFAGDFLMESKSFDYIDLDPFGTPVPFLDAVMQKLKQGSVLAVTATDTTVLCGAEYKACVRRYKARPLHNYLMHEVGVRILIKYVQEVGLNYKLSLKPIFSQSTRHYMRVYFKVARNFNPTKQIKKWKEAGPMWLGKLWDVELVENMYRLAVKDKNISEETRSLFSRIMREAKIPTVGFFDLAEMKLKQVPKLQKVIETLWAKGFAAARTHFSPTGIKTNASEKEFSRVLKAL